MRERERETKAACKSALHNSAQLPQAPARSESNRDLCCNGLCIILEIVKGKPEARRGGGEKIMAIVRKFHSHTHTSRGTKGEHIEGVTLRTQVRFASAAAANLCK